MKKSFLKLLSVIICTMFVCIWLCACQGNSNNGSSFDKRVVADDGYNENSDIKDESSSKSSGSGSAKTLTDTSRKIVEHISYTVEIKSDNDFKSVLSDEIKDLGGYISSSKSYGTDSDYNNDYYEIKIPKDKKDKFSSFIEENTNVTYKSIDTKDVTLDYVDVESRISALKKEKEALESFLKSAKTVSEIIDIQDRLSEVIYEIESYQSQLRAYDNDTEYTSFTLTVNTVKEESPTGELSFWGKTGKNLKQNFRLVGAFFANLAIFIISSLPFVLVIAVIAIIVLIIVKLCIRKSKNKKKSLSSPTLNLNQDTTQTSDPDFNKYKN